MYLAKSLLKYLIVFPFHFNSFDCFKVYIFNDIFFEGDSYDMEVPYYECVNIPTSWNDIVSSVNTLLRSKSVRLNNKRLLLNVSKSNYLLVNLNHRELVGPQLNIYSNPLQRVTIIQRILY